MNQTPKPPLIVLMVSAAVTFIFSFLDQVDVPFQDIGTTAWSGIFFPLMTWVPLLALCLGALAAVRTFAPAVLPQTLASFTPKQLGLVLVVPAFLIILGYLMLGDDWWGDADKGTGFWFMFFGTIGLLTGVIMDLMDKTPDRQVQIGGQDPQQPQQGFQAPGQPQQFQQGPPPGGQPQQGFQPPAGNPPPPGANPPPPAGSNPPPPAGEPPSTGATPPPMPDNPPPPPGDSSPPPPPPPS